MKIQFKRFDKSLPLPAHKTPGSAGVDLYSRIDVDIKPKEIAYIPMNVAIKIPKDHFILLSTRSSTHKLGLMAINGVGIMDSDYCGDNDEYHFAAYNYTDQVVHIEKGTRLVQLVLMQYNTFEIEELDHFDTADRGGFGTTGLK